MPTSTPLSRRSEDASIEEPVFSARDLRKVYGEGGTAVHALTGVDLDLYAGEMLVLPKGWKGEWTIHEPTRKLYILHFEAA